MLYFLSPSAHHSIRQHAECEYPDECVGLLLGYKDTQQVIIQQAYPAPNSAADPGSMFSLAPHIYLQADHYAHAQGMDILALYHSHPDHDVHPSAHDIAGLQATGTGWLYFIQSVYAGKAVDLCAWQLDSTGCIMYCTYSVSDN